MVVVEAGIAASGAFWGMMGLASCCKFVVADQEIEAAALDAKPDAITAPNQTQRSARGGFRRDVEDDGAKGGAAHAGV